MDLFKFFSKQSSKDVAKERLKLIPYESLVGLTMTIVSTIIFGIILK